jgi:uncharacterized protein YecT (DUF1311 family)
MTEPERGQDVHRTMSRVNWTTVALIAGLILLVGIIAYFAIGGNENQDKLSDTQIIQAQPENVEQRCANKTTYDLIKVELFRRAAQLRGSDQAAYDQLSRVAVIRMDNPVMEGEDSKTGAIDCSGSLSLDLPPGVAAVGGRRTLMSDIDYTVDSSGGVALRNADAIIAPLAMLSRIAQPAPEVPMPVETNETAPENIQENVAASESAAVQPGPPSKYPGRPSFDCNRVHSKGELAVCSDTGLSALDINMATQYRRSLAAATPEQAALLRQTRERFLRYRDRCPNNACIGEAYVGRMREIRDITEGRYPPPR